MTELENFKMNHGYIRSYNVESQLQCIFSTIGIFVKDIEILKCFDNNLEYCFIDSTYYYTERFEIQWLYHFVEKGFTGHIIKDVFPDGSALLQTIGER